MFTALFFSYPAHGLCQPYQCLEKRLEIEDIGKVEVVSLCVGMDSDEGWLPKDRQMSC